MADTSAKERLVWEDGDFIITEPSDAPSFPDPIAEVKDRKTDKPKRKVASKNKK